MKREKSFLILALAMMSVLMFASFASAGVPVVNMRSNTSNTLDTTPDVVFNFTDVTNTTASCVLYINGASSGTNASTVNWTDTTITSTRDLGYGSFNTHVTCTTLDGNRTDSRSIILTVHSLTCDGAQRSIATILAGMFMIGILVFLAYSFMGGNLDVKTIVAAVVILLLMVVMVAVLNPIFNTLCGV